MITSCYVKDELTYCLRSFSYILNYLPIDWVLEKIGAINRVRRALSDGTPQKKKTHKTKNKIPKSWPDQDQPEYLVHRYHRVKIKKPLKIIAPFPRVCSFRIWAQLIALGKIYLLAYFFSKYNHFIIRYDFPQHFQGKFDSVTAGYLCGWYFLLHKLPGCNQNKLLLHLSETCGGVIELTAKHLTQPFIWERNHHINTCCHIFLLSRYNPLFRFLVFIFLFCFLAHFLCLINYFIFCS